MNISVILIASGLLLSGSVAGFAGKNPMIPTAPAIVWDIHFAAVCHKND